MPDDRSRYTIDGSRLWESIMQMASIGATAAGGVCRLTLTELDRQARELFREWAEAAGCSVSVDPAGNMFARRPGRDNTLPPVAVGSHLDSQPTGGRFDGAYGVLAGLEIVRTLNDRGIETRAPVEVVNWTNEEGARFAPVMLGSGTFVGVHSLEQARAQRDADGCTFGEALDRIGYAGSAPMSQGHPVDTFLEVHIEQGPILERTSTPVGIVSGAQGISWYDIVVRGTEGHAGTVPMGERRDALVAASALVSAYHQIALEYGSDTRMTVGDLRVHPGSRNTIPGRVSLSLDVRNPEGDQLDVLDGMVREAAAREAQRHDVQIDVTRNSRTEPVAFDETVIDAMRRAAAAAGISHREMLSGAGHDACHLARVVPTGLLFVPCRDGVSHNEAESAEPGDLAAGCEVLYRVLLERAGGGT